MAPLRLLLEGPPRVGKSTVLWRLADLLRARGVTIAGFIAEEIRASGERVGFRVEALDHDGQEIFAHVDHMGPVRVGRYGVDLPALERIAIPAMQVPAPVLLIDELGRMQLASGRFREHVTVAFDTAPCVVATVHVFTHPFTDTLKARSDVWVIRVSAGNRDLVPADIAERIITRFG